MTAAPYPIIGVIVGLAVLVAGIWHVIHEEDDTDLLVLGVLIVIGVAAVAGVVWPLTLVAAVIVGLALAARHALQRREDRQHRRLRGRDAPYFVSASNPAPSAYRRMAEQQRTLAARYRSLGEPELVESAERLERQYRDMARHDEETR